jgi:hypothetical protein
MFIVSFHLNLEQLDPSCVADPGSIAFLTPRSGIQDGKKFDSGIGIIIPVHIN